jgi:hypothetical protein
MNPAAILALISDLYTQVGQLQQEAAEKDARIAELEEGAKADG